MPRRCPILPAALLLLACASAASAKDGRDSRALAPESSQGLDQAVYKGLVGNALDAIPMDPARRVDLQRTNAVVSSTLSGRSLAALVGWSNPVLLLGGFVWGVWAASNIKAQDASTIVAAGAGASVDGAKEQSVVALLEHAPAAGGALAKAASEALAADPISVADTSPAQLARPHVIKVWLPQRSGR